VWSEHGGAPSDYQEHGHTARQAQTHRYVHYDDIISHAHTRTHKHTHVLLCKRSLGLAQIIALLDIKQPTRVSKRAMGREQD